MLQKTKELGVALLYLRSLGKRENVLSIVGPSFEKGITRIKEKDEPIAVGQQDPTGRLVGPCMDGTDVVSESREPFRPLPH